LKKKSGQTPPNFWEKSVRFIFTLEELPYGASLLIEKNIAKSIMGIGLKVMALGGMIFAGGWKIKVNWILETAFVITLVGWMMLIIGFAFWTVSGISKRI